MNTAVVVMTKIPVPGYAKTRMMPEMTADECAGFYKACLADIFRTVKETGYTGFLYYAGPKTDQDALKNKNLLGMDEDTFMYFEIRPQRGNNLGQRMQNAIREVLADFEAVIVIGGDVPELNSSLLQEAANRLHYFDVVLGPAIDGGYYLAAMTQPDLEIFTDIPWGTSDVLHITLEKLKKAKKAFSLLPELHDIDTWEDINLYCERRKNSGENDLEPFSCTVAEKLVQK